MSRSYGQLCGLALALDLIGDRWSLLIVRELLVRPEGARYTDLRDGLPGIATNLLADRLRELESTGVIRREPPRPPVATWPGCGWSSAPVAPGSTSIRSAFSVTPPRA